LRVKIAVVGAGMMGMNHLRLLRDFARDEVQLVGIAETHEPTLKLALNRFHVAGYTDYRQMIKAVQPDLVSVVVPTYLHYEVASHALDQGINVLIEKPMAATVEDARKLISLARLRGAKIAIGSIERFNPAVIEAKRRLLEGELGQVFHLHARRLGPFPPRIRDVGVTLDLATHDLEVMRYLTNAEIDRVYAETRRRIHHKYEDLMLGTLQFTNGAVGMLDVNRLTPTKIRELSVTGDKGMYLINYLTQDLYFYENDCPPPTQNALSTPDGVSEGAVTRLKVQKAEPLRLEYEDVVAALRNDTSPSVTGEDGLAVLKTAIELSGASHEEYDATSETKVAQEVGSRI